MKKQEEIEFEFQEVPLEEAKIEAMVGDGHYAHIKSMLMLTLPKLAADKAFAFGLPHGKEVEEALRKGLIMSISGTLKKAQIPWRVVYSQQRKLFLCVPRVAKNGVATGATASRVQPQVVNKGPAFRSDVVAFRNQVIELSAQGVTPAEIARKLNAKNGRVNGVYYKYVKKKKYRTGERS